VAVAMMGDGMLGAALRSPWLASVSDARLHAAVRVLLIAIGALLLVESVGLCLSTGLPLGRAALAPSRSRSCRSSPDQPASYPFSSIRS
jgi:hypothetical protein